MTKKMGLFLLAFVLVALAVATSSAPVEATTICLKPDCFASPGCCVASQCAKWCEFTGGGYPGCTGGGQGGCCFCSGAVS
jgi:hypothetical protein